jgi:serralysin
MAEKIIYDGDDFREVVRQSASFPYDEIYTYGGNDDIYLKYSATTVFAGAGSDYVNSTVERGNDIDLGSGNDIYIGTGYSGNSANYDIVSGGDGSDKFYISTWASKYYGEAGNDTFYSVGFNNLISGGSGTDTVDYSRQNSDADLAGKGIQVDLSQGYATSGGGREEDLVSIESAKGTSYKDTLIGSSGSNGLWGQSGDDVLRGYGGNDRLYGGNGNDDLYGGSDNDDLYGGRGNDYLKGDSGSDLFIFQSVNDSPNTSSRDVIADFSRSQGDKIDLSDIDAIESSSRDSAFDFIGSASFSGTAGELRYSGGIVRGDVDGDGVADFSIKIDNGASLRASDFIL